MSDFIPKPSGAKIGGLSRKAQKLQALKEESRAGQEWRKAGGGGVWCGEGEGLLRKHEEDDIPAQGCVVGLHHPEDSMTLAGGNRALRCSLMTAALLGLAGRGVMGFAQNVPMQVAAWDTGRSRSSVGVDILSDTQGIDFSPYVRQILKATNGSWQQVLAKDGRPAVKADAVTLIRIEVGRDGKLRSMQLEGDGRAAALDKAAWHSLAQLGSTGSLPPAYTGSGFAMRVHFSLPKEPAR